MANVVKLPYSNTAGNVPASLENGQVGVQQADGRLYYRTSSGNVTLLPLIVEASTTAVFPAVGAVKTIYVATDTGRCYHWVNNSVYVEIGPPAGPSQASGAYIYSLPPATTANLGGVIAGSGTAIATDGTISVPPATLIALGGVKVGANIGVAIDGTISVAAPVTTLPANSIAGLATVAKTGAYSDLTGTPTIPSAYTLPAATASVLGGVKQGANTTIAADGTISVSGLATVATSGSASDLSAGTLPVARLPLATVSAAGAMIVGSGLSVSGGTVSAAVTSVNTKTGAVVLAASDVGAIASNTTGITGAVAVGNIVSLTAAQYTALGTKTATTLYVVTG